jgi:hypothetical protein
MAFYLPSYIKHYTLHISFLLDNIFQQLNIINKYSIPSFTKIII